jgi:hypothetical protein
MPSSEERTDEGHEVDFGNAPVRVQIYSTEQSIEILIEADFGDATGAASAFRPSQHSSPPIQRSRRRSGATCREPPSYFLDVTSEASTVGLARVERRDLGVVFKSPRTEALSPLFCYRDFANVGRP